MSKHHLILGLVAVNGALTMALLGRDHGEAAASDPGTVRARAIELVDERGRVRAQLNVEPDGEAVFRLRDAAGEIRVKLGAGEDGSGLLLLNGSTEPGIHLLAKKSGTQLTLASQGGQRRVITP
jgi:hypothetical protein